MTLVLEVISHNGSPLSAPLNARFDENGGSIGRREDNRLVLADEDKIIGRVHADIRYESGTFIYTDQSLNGTELCGQNRTLIKEAVPLADGDRLKIGEYELLVHIEAAASGFDRPFDDAPSYPGYSMEDVESTPYAESSPPLGEKPLPEDFSFSNLFEQNQPADILPEESGAHFDWLVWDDGQHETPLEQGSHPSDGLSPDPSLDKDNKETSNGFFGGYGTVAPLSDTILGEGIAATPDAISENVNFSETSEIPGKHEDALASAATIRLAPPSPPQPPRPPPEPESEIPAPTINIPNPAQPVTTESRPKPDVASAARLETGANLFQCFLDGAGLEPPNSMTAEEQADTMKNLGLAFRHMVGGMMASLRARAEEKYEIRADVTRIHQEQNNPLKFIPTVEGAMSAMLYRKNIGKGYLDTVSAVRQGFTDISNHEMAMRAAMQASVEQILRKFAPASFEKLSEGGMVFQSKEAKCWKTYCAAYPKLKDEAMEGLFRGVFLQAYEEQARRLDEAHGKKSELS